MLFTKKDRINIKKEQYIEQSKPSKRCGIDCYNNQIIVICFKVKKIIYVKRAEEIFINKNNLENLF